MAQLTGLDIGSRYIKAINIQTIGAKPTITRFFIHEISQQEPLLSQLSRLVEKWKLRGKRVVTSVSGKEVFIRYLTVPTRPEKELKTWLKYELGKHIPLEPAEFLFDCQILGGKLCQNIPASEMRIAIAAAKKTHIKEHITLLRSAGLIPEIIDVDPFCLTNIYTTIAKHESDGKITAFIDVGASKTTISIMCDGFSFFAREIYKAGNDITFTISKKMSIPLEQAEQFKKDPENSEKISPYAREVAEDIASDVNLSMKFFEDQHETEINYVILSGGGAKLPAVREALAEILDREILLFNPIEALHNQLDSTSFVNFRDNVLQVAVCLGLAIRNIIK